MIQLYSIAQVSKQALHQFLHRYSHQQTIKEGIIKQGDLIRERHPRMGCRSMHRLMQNIEIGRDRCEAILLAHGFRVKRKSNVFRTTVSQQGHSFPDLIKGKIITGINQVWQTDITYYLADHRSVYYIIFIEDIYSRRILGWCAHDHLRADANIACLKRAFRIRRDSTLKGLIHHSDRGSQYVDKDYLHLLRDKGIQISMCREAWHNAYTERLNGTIKNSYLYCMNIQTLSGLRKELDRAVKMYNWEKPHKNLPNQMSPMAFEKYLETENKRKHPVFKIYDYE